MLLHEIVASSAAAAPDALALVDGGRRFTFARLHELVGRVTAGTAATVAPGERVAIAADNRAEFVAALYGVPAAGAVLVMLNTRHTAGEQADVLRSSGASAVVGTAAQLARLLPLAGELASVRTWWSLDPDAPPGSRPFSELLGDPGPPVADGDEHAPAWLIHTSGTTGRPKGAMLTHRSLMAAVLNTAMGRPVADDDVYLFPFPLFHVAAYNVLHHHLRRRPVVLLPGFDAATAMATIGRERVTSTSLAPTMVAMLLGHPDRAAHDLSSLRRIAYGAAAMPLDLVRRTATELPGVGLAQGYGMTELSGNCVFLGPDEHRRAVAGEPELLSAAGRPAPLVRLRIVDDDGVDVAPGDPGEIWVRGDQVCAGYWDDPAAWARAWSDGWLRTGDVGRIDAAGYLHVVDRKKDLIITGGENVSSREVEDVVSQHPAVDAVAAVGVPDDRWGERVCVAVVWRPGTAAPSGDELIEWTRDRLAGFKRPRLVLALDALPLNASGKVDKRLVRAVVAGQAPGPAGPSPLAASSPGGDTGAVRSREEPA